MSQTYPVAFLSREEIIQSLKDQVDSEDVIPFTIAAFADAMDLDSINDHPKDTYSKERNEDPIPPFPYLWTRGLVNAKVLPEALSEEDPRWDGFGYFSGLFNYLINLHELGHDSGLEYEALADLEIWLREDAVARATIVSTFLWYCSEFALIEMQDVNFAHDDDISEDGTHKLANDPPNPDVKTLNAAGEWVPLDTSLQYQGVFDIRLPHAPGYIFQAPLPASYQTSWDALPEQFRIMVDNIHSTACHDS